MCPSASPSVNPSVTLLCDHTETVSKQLSLYVQLFSLFHSLAAQLSDIPGYNFSTNHHMKMSYLNFLDSAGLLRPEGSPISFDKWLKSQFMLVFRTSFELGRFNASTAENVIQSPFAANQTYHLYLRFAAPLEQTLRVSRYVAGFPEIKSISRTKMITKITGKKSNLFAMQVTVLYRVARRLQLSQEREGFLLHGLNQ